jgi:hypothetical protein
MVIPEKAGRAAALALPAFHSTLTTLTAFIAQLVRTLAVSRYGARPCLMTGGSAGDEVSADEDQEPLHDLIMEGLLDNVETAVASGC